MARPNAVPSFGDADLSNCEREQIHLAGSIQPHGALLVVDDTVDLTIVQASDNAEEFLGLRSPIVGRQLAAVSQSLVENLGSILPTQLTDLPGSLRCQIGRPARPFDVLVHRPVTGGVLIELEPAGPPVDLSGQVARALKSFMSAPSLPRLCDEAARLFKELTGYDRVMVYRFDEEGHGEVFSERREATLEPFVGNRYPASDIPQIARRLYERTRVRMLVDVNYAAVPVVPRLSPLSGQELDMSLCFLRSMSPIHIQYLKNMGVGATLVASLMVGGKLWGLISCHHYSPRITPYETRAACELLAETVATRIAALDGFVQAQAELAVRRIEQRMIQAISRDGDWRSALFDDSKPLLLQALGATGAALIFEDQVLTLGDVPGTQQLRDIGTWLAERHQESVAATASLGLDEPSFAPLAEVASGVVAARISNSPGEYLMWLRGEQVRTVTWGGDPFKPMVVGNDPSDLSPRRSFAQWHQVVEGTSEPWSAAQMAAARLMGEIVKDIVLQFRAVRLLIAQDQVDQVTRQVRAAEQPVIVADAVGQILVHNAASAEIFARAPTLQLKNLTDLADLFAAPEDARSNLTDLVENSRSWRAEVTLGGEGEPALLLIRADPILTAPQRLLGFVVLLTDLTERQRAEAARLRFQEGLVEQHRLAPMRLDSQSDLLFRNLLASVVGNAQLAALEITDGADLAQLPELLESVRASMLRTTELLEQLISHASGRPPTKPH
ncbi:MAG: GAF domain-containing protein [Geminicoccaceae bacterium]